jgi:hypothetical protein
LNEGQAAGQGVSNAFDLYNQNFNFSQSQVNPFTVGLSGISNLAGTASNLGYDPFSSSSSTMNPWQSSELSYLSNNPSIWGTPASYYGQGSVASGQGTLQANP